MRIPAPAGFPGLEDLLGTASDDSKARCASLLRALTDLYLQRPVHTLEDDHYYTELALRLIDAADVSDRAALAARLAAYPSAPLPVLKRLARDAIEVAGPILQRLPHLRTAEFESPTAADTRAHSQVIAFTVLSQPRTALILCIQSNHPSYRNCFIAQLRRNAD